MPDIHPHLPPAGATVSAEPTVPPADAGLAAESPAAAPRAPAGVVVELRVRNHPGAMSHITGLFARRAFNLEAILCVPETDRAHSRMLLLVANDPKLEQVERQLAKLHDVTEVRLRTDLAGDLFRQFRW